VPRDRLRAIEHDSRLNHDGRGLRNGVVREAASRSGRAVGGGVRLGDFVLPNRRASSLSSFSVTAASMILARSPSGTMDRIRACSLSSLARSSDDAVNWTLWRPGDNGTMVAGSWELRSSGG
jgi:hypothetical protein